MQTETGLISNNDETNYRREIDDISTWCTDNNQRLNVLKTQEMVVDFRRNKAPLDPIIIDNTVVEQVNVAKFLGIFLSSDLTWHVNCSEILKKAKQRLHFLRILASFKVDTFILTCFYRCIIESILTNCIVIWYGRATQKDLNLMSSVIRQSEKIIGVTLPSLKDIYEKRLKKKTDIILIDEHHPAYKYFDLMPSGRRYRHFKGNKRFIDSTFPQAVRF